MGRDRVVERLTSGRPVNPEKNAISEKIGGTTVWAPSAADLQSGLQALTLSIDGVARTHLTAVRSVLKTLVQGEIGNVDDRVFGAVLGRCQRFAILDELLVLSRGERLYRAYFHRCEKHKVQSAVRAAGEALADRNEIPVKDFEIVIFGARSYNTWSSASHCLGHHAYTGFAEEVEPGLFRRVAGLL